MAGWGWPLQKYNLTATVAPGVTDDIDSDYQVGSVWVDTVGLVAYQCIDNSRGAAVWKAAGGGGFPASPCAWAFATYDGSAWINALFTFDVSGDLISDGSGYPVMVAC